MLPPPYYHVHYDASSGDILSFINPHNGCVTEEPTILISAEDHRDIHGQAHLFRVVDGAIALKPVMVPLIKPVVIDVNRALIAGFIRDGICFAISPSALSVLLLDLAANAEFVRAVVHTSTGNELVELNRATAISVATDIAEHVAMLHCG